METKNDTVAMGTARAAAPGRVAFYHANGRGTGCALLISLQPADNLQGGGLVLEFARQKTVGAEEEGRRTFPTFDWTNHIALKMDLMDCTRMLEVFRGIKESIEDGKGLWHRGQNHETIFRLEHRVEPISGFLLCVTRKEKGNAVAEEAHIVLTMTEALGLSLALEQEMGLMAFGVAK